MSLASVASYAGFVLMVAGVCLVAGLGYACLFAGGLLFAAGNLTERTR